MNLFSVLLKKDFLLLSRGKEKKAVPCLFALTLLFLFSFFKSRSTLSLYPLLFVVTNFFAFLIFLEQDFQEEEKGNACLLSLLHLEDKGLWLLSKAAAYTLFFFCFQLFFFALSLIFFDLPLPHPFLGLLPLFSLVALGLSGLGITLTFLSLGSSLSYKLLPLLLFPLSFPLLFAAVHELAYLLGFISASSALLFLFSYDCLFLALGYLFFPAMIE